VITSHISAPLCNKQYTDVVKLAPLEGATTNNMINRADPERKCDKFVVAVSLALAENPSASLRSSLI
jgi:hypothetical protein